MHQHQLQEQQQQQLESYSSSVSVACSAAAVDASCPRFREIGSPQKISAAIDTNPQLHQTVKNDDENNSSSEFEFSFAVRDPEDQLVIIDADEIFLDGRIKPIYPVFNRDLLLVPDEEETVVGEEEEENKPQQPQRLPLHRLLLEEREALMVRSGSVSSSSEADDLDGVPPESYCVWAPPPAADRLSRKSRSTGSSLRWRLRDLVVGRSHSDGKEKFVFFSADAANQHNSSKRETITVDTNSNSKNYSKLELKSSKKEMKEKKEIDVATADRIFIRKPRKAVAVLGKVTYLTSLI